MIHTKNGQSQVIYIRTPTLTVLCHMTPEFVVSQVAMVTNNEQVVFGPCQCNICSPEADIVDTM